jgi:hypothetical protein
MKKPAHRPKGPRKLPPLHPSTLAALAGQARVEFTDTGELATFTPAAPSKGQKIAAMAACTVAIDPRLVELALNIAATRGTPALRDLFNEESDRLAHVAKVAAMVGDVAFFIHAAEAVEVAEKSAGCPKRLVFAQAWLEARKTNALPHLSEIREGMKYRLGRVDPDSPAGEIRIIPGHVGDDEIRNFSKALGMGYQSRRSVKK